jgi:hypothetical protein
MYESWFVLTSPSKFIPAADLATEILIISRFFSKGLNELLLRLFELFGLFGLFEIIVFELIVFELIFLLLPPIIKFSLAGEPMLLLLKLELFLLFSSGRGLD